MKTPKPRKLPSGNWFIQLRIGGESIPVTAATAKDCTREAAAIKAEWLARKRLPEKPDEPTQALTMTASIDEYIKRKSRTLSPSTIRGYRAIQKHRFQTVMQRPVDGIQDSEWQALINAEMAQASPKTVVNAFKFLRTVIRQQTGHEIPLNGLTLPSVPPADTAFLTADEIPKFVDTIKDSRVAVAALLALSSLRISEISALSWENIPAHPTFIKVSGAVVRGSDTAWVKKKQNKNRTSTRSVPILIPELSEAIERLRKPSGPVMDYDQDTLRVEVHKACQRAKITDVTVHGLRHSFASLAYHLQVPEKIAMEIGGWSDPGTMHKIYTHIAQSDIARYQTAMADFYSKKKDKNANENANTENQALKNQDL